MEIRSAICHLNSLLKNASDFSVMFTIRIKIFVGGIFSIDKRLYWQTVAYSIQFDSLLAVESLITGFNNTDWLNHASYCLPGALGNVCISMKG